MNDPELTDLFRRSRDEESWHEPLPDPGMIWRRARAADLLAEELRRRERKTWPLAAARNVAGIAILVAAELGVLEGFFEMPAEWGKTLAAAGLSPWTVMLLVAAALPTVALVHRLRRETPEA